MNQPISICRHNRYIEVLPGGAVRCEDCDSYWKGIVEFSVDIQKQVKKSSIKEYRELHRRKFECEFCGHKYVTQGEAYKRHVSICYFNPERYCERCENTGTELLPTLGIGLGIIPDGKEIPCSACATSKERGGYYYENEELKKGIQDDTSIG